MSIFKRKIAAKAQRQTLSPHHIQTREYRLLDLDHSNELLPMITKITRQSRAMLKPIQNRLNNMVPADPRNSMVKQEYEQIVQHWAGKIERLGLKVHGLWQVGFDSGIGWYGWQYPERRIRYFIEYGEYFRDRQLIRQSLTDDEINSLAEHK